MPGHTEHKIDRWPVILLRSASLALTYERAHASHPARAIRAFIKGQMTLLARLLRLGLDQHVRLARLELECAQAGLGYSRTGDSDGPPWCLPDTFATLPVEALPRHPLIDPSWLSELVSKQSGSQIGALSVLHELILPDGLSGRWVDVPRVGHADLPIPGNARVAVCLHLYYPEMWPMLSTALEAIPEPWDLYVSVPEFACTQVFATIAREHPAVRFFPCANRGRDVLPFLRWLDMGVFDRYDAVCKLHSKRSPHIRDGANWLSQVLQSLLGEREAVAQLLTKIRGTPEIGMLGPQTLQIDSDHPMHRGSNRQILKALAARASLSTTKLEAPFFAGTMFWFRPAAIVGLRTMGLLEENFPIEMAQTDGTPAHALERLIGLMVEQAGFKVGYA